MIIAIEGIDGSGKSTQVERLKNTVLKDAKIFKPFDDLGLGDEIRDLLHRHESSTYITGMLMAFVHARVKQALDQIPDRIVLLDRSVPSFFAYQKSFFLTPDGQVLKKLFGPLLPEPDYVALLDLPAEAAFKRVNVRETSQRDNFNDLTIQKQVRDHYLAQAKDNPAWDVFDASKTSQDITQELKGALSRRGIV